MNARNIIITLLVIALVLGGGWYVADMVKKNPGEMTCVLGIGPDDYPTLCYVWSQKAPITKGQFM